MNDLCSGPLCVRDIKRIRGGLNDIRFTVDIRTSLGVVKIKGWRWLRGVNRIVNPTCNGHHLMVVPLHLRSIVRKLLTQGVANKYGFEIPNITTRVIRGIVVLPSREDVNVY